MPAASATVPADFDAEGFERIAKMIFIRMQAANDSADLDDLRAFTTPELFASIRLDLQERGNARAEDRRGAVDAEVLDVAQRGPSARSSACVSAAWSRGTRCAQPDAFDEVWHLVQAAGRQPQLGHRRHPADGRGLIA
jgi:predicted lipid-binding transport protein (Tim44 family)